MPASVKTIEDRAFYECKNLQRVTFIEGSQLREIGKYAFYETGIAEVQIPASVQSIGGYAFWECKNLQRVTFAEGSQLKEIGEHAFYGCNNFVLTLPEGLTSIGNEWFKGSGIKEVQIPASVQTIG